MRSVFIAASLLAACTFDRGGIAVDDDGDVVDGDQNLPDAALSAPPDAIAPDAAPGCRDGDGDGYAVSVGGAACVQPVDCDDADARAYPGQDEFFTTERTSGGFDFDCDDVETKINASTGDNCGFDFFSCEGTGWMSAVPACGQPGIWHRCVDNVFSCDEEDRFAANMPCR